MIEMKKHIYDENNGLGYELIGDYYIPILILSSEEQKAAKEDIDVIPEGSFYATMFGFVVCALKTKGKMI